MRHPTLDSAQTEQVSLLYEAIPTAMFATVLNAIVVTVVLWGHVPVANLVGWLSAVTAISAARYALARAYQTNESFPSSAAVWQTRFYLGMIAAAFAWGGSVFIIFPEASSAHQILLAMVIAGICAGAVSTLTYQWRAIALFLTIILVPVTIRFMLGGDDLSQAVALMAILFLLTLMVSARRIYNTNQTNLMLRESASAMAADAKASEARFRHLLQAAPDALLIIDPAGRIEYANQRAQKLFGYALEEILQVPIRQLLPQLDRFTGEATPHGTQRDLAALTRTGTEFPSDLTFSTIPFPEGSRVCLAVRDVTERYQTEESLRRAKVAAETANQAKSAFLSSMSHELRTPLNAILGFAELMRDESNLTLEQRDNLGEIFDSGEHLLKLINDILDLSKIEAGRMQLSIERVRLQDIAETCRGMIEPMARKNDIGLNFEMDSCHNALVLADRTRLLQALLNLASNAIKYNQPNGSVTLSCHKQANRLRLSVKDTGPGISPDKQRDLFLPFSRLGKEFSSIEGTGIGLALTKQIVELMQGELGFSSSPGEGSTFWLEFPYVGEYADAAEAPPADARSVAEEHDATLLSIEDNPLNQHMIRQILTKHDGHYRLLLASDPLRGLALARDNRPTLILLDINMPGMDGFEVLEQLRDDPQTCHIPVIAVTATNPDTDPGLLGGGFEAILHKPIEKTALLATIRKILDQAAARHPK